MDSDKIDIDFIHQFMNIIEIYKKIVTSAQNIHPYSNIKNKHDASLVQLPIEIFKRKILIINKINVFYFFRLQFKTIQKLYKKIRHKDIHKFHEKPLKS